MKTKFNFGMFPTICGLKPVHSMKAGPECILFEKCVQFISCIILLYYIMVAES